MILGTHNTMTYRNPKKWFLYPIKWIAQCQSKNYKEQFEKYNVHAFDLRVFWDKNENLEFRHGLFSYKADDFYEIINFCNKNNIYVRLFFEERNFKHILNRTKKYNLEKRFKALCKQIVLTHPNLKIYGGRNTRIWEVLYQFNMEDPKETELYSSVTSLFKGKNSFLKVVDDLFPRLYAWIKNKKHRKNKQYNNLLNEGIEHYDFIEIN